MSNMTIRKATAIQKKSGKLIGKGICNNVMRQGDFVWVSKDPDLIIEDDYNDQCAHDAFTKEIARNLKVLKSDVGEINRICRLLSQGLTPFEIRKETGYPICLIHEIRRGKLGSSVRDQYPTMKSANRKLDAVYRLLAEGHKYDDVEYLAGVDFEIVEYCHRELEMDGCDIPEHDKFVNLSDHQIAQVRKWSHRGMSWPDIAEKLDIAEDYIAIINYSDDHFKTNSTGLYSMQERRIMYGKYSPWQKLYAAMFYKLPKRDPLAFEVEVLNTLIPFLNATCSIEDGYSIPLFPSKKDRPVVLLCERFGLNSDGTKARPMSFAALSKKFNIPISQVKLIIAKALRRLRLHLTRPNNRYLLDLFEDRPETYSPPPIPNDVKEWPISCLKLSTRIENVLRGRKIKTIGEAMLALANNENIGKRSIVVVDIALESFRLDPSSDAHEYIPEYTNDALMSDSIDRMLITRRNHEGLVDAKFTLVGHVVDAYHAGTLRYAHCGEYWSIVYWLRNNHLIPQDRFK